MSFSAANFDTKLSLKCAQSISDDAAHIVSIASTVVQAEQTAIFTTIGASDVATVVPTCGLPHRVSHLAAYVYSLNAFGSADWSTFFAAILSP